MNESLNKRQPGIITNVQIERKTNTEREGERGKGREKEIKKETEAERELKRKEKKRHKRTNKRIKAHSNRAASEPSLQSTGLACDRAVQLNHFDSSENRRSFSLAQIEYKSSNQGK